MRLRPAVPRSAPTVRAAVRLIQTGAGLALLSLIVSLVSLAHVGRNGASLRLAGRIQPLPVAIAVGVLGALLVTTLWLFMARACSQGRSWARPVSTVLFGLATLELISVATGTQTVLGLIFWAPTWVLGLAAVWMLWRPTSSEFFKGPGVTPAGHSA